MGKVVKVLVGSVVFSAAVTAFVVGIKVFCNRRKEKNFSSNDIDDFVVYVTTPEDNKK